MSHLFQKDSITSTQVTIALERESNCRSSKEVLDLTKDKDLPTVSAAQASTRCTFCRRRGHYLTTCRAAAKVLKQSRVDHRSNDTSNSSQSRNQPRQETSDTRDRDHCLSSDKRNKAVVVVMLDSSDESDSYQNQASTTRVLSTGPGSFPDNLDAQALACKKQDWLADTGCLHIMSPDDDDVIDASPQQFNIRLANHLVIKSTHQGTVSLPFQVSSPPKVLLVPDLEEPLLSISSVCNGGCEALFTSTSMTVYPGNSLTSSSTALATGTRRNNLYYLPNEVRSFYSNSSVSKAHVLSLFDWHRCLGYIGLKPHKQLLRQNGITPLPNNEIDVQKCETCVQSKMHRMSFKSRDSYRARSPGEIIHSNVGSFEVVSLEG